MYKKITVFMGAVLLTLGILFAFFSQTMVVKADSSATVYHRHTGNSTSGGGCYGSHKTGSEPCNASLTDIWFNGVDYSYKCNHCGNTWHYIYQLDGIRCPNTYSYDYYDCSCGKGGAALATFSCSPSTTDWAKEVQLNASVNVLDSSFGVSSYLWNGQAGGSSCTVTSNGTYTLQLTGNENSDTSASVSVTVNNIDAQAPVISSFAPDPSGWTTAATLNVTASDSISGLHGSAYSFDGGATWQSSSALQVTSNGTYSVQVRDNAGNTASASVEISQIDQTQPEVSYQTSPALADWYDGDLTISVTASDGQSGLSATPYSFDGGATYLVNGSYTINQNSSLDIVVRDQAGNTAHVQASFTKKVRPTPVPTQKPAATPVPTQKPAAVTPVPTQKPAAATPTLTQKPAKTTPVPTQKPAVTAAAGNGGGSNDRSEKAVSGSGNSAGGSGTNGSEGSNREQGDRAGENTDPDKQSQVMGEGEIQDTDQQQFSVKGAGKGNTLPQIIDTVRGDQSDYVEESAVVELPELVSEGVVTATVIRHDDSRVWLVAAAALIAALSGLAALVLGLRYLRLYVTATAFIYGRKSNGRYRYLGRVRLKQVGEQLELVMPKTLTDRGRTVFFRIRVSYKTSQKYRKTNLLVRYGRSSRSVKMEQNMKIEL